MKFKVGDKVKVVRVFDTTGNHREEEVGKILTIKSANHMGLECYPRKGVNYYGFGSGETDYIFYEDELELVSFTKADLKDGMVVECRDGERYLVINDKFICNKHWFSISQFANDLSGSKYEYTIDKIYQTTGYSFETLFDNNYLTLIWEREKPAKKMTVEEIEKELGYKVEIVSDNNNQ